MIFFLPFPVTDAFLHLDGYFCGLDQIMSCNVACVNIIMLVQEVLSLYCILQEVL